MLPAATAVTVARNVARRDVFLSFLSLCSSSVKSRYVFSRSVKVCRGRGSPARYGLSRMVLRSIPACHVLLGPLTFCYVAIKFCYVYQVLSRTVGDEWCLNPNMPTV